MLNRRKILVLGALAAAGLVSAGLGLVAQPIWKRIVGRQPDGSYLLPTGQVVRPLGKIIEVNDRPLGIGKTDDSGLVARLLGLWFEAEKNGKCRHWKFVLPSGLSLCSPPPSSCVAPTGQHQLDTTAQGRSMPATSTTPTSRRRFVRFGLSGGVAKSAVTASARLY